MWDKKVYQALSALGWSSVNEKIFNSYGSIRVHFDALPDLILYQQEEKLWIWSHLESLTEAVAQERAQKLLPILTTLVYGIEGGLPTLGFIDDGYEFKYGIKVCDLTGDEHLVYLLLDFVDNLRRLVQIFMI